MKIELLELVDSKTSRGNLPKGWYNINGDVFLVKGNFHPNMTSGHTYDPYSEAMATLIARRLGFEHINYMLLPKQYFPDLDVYGINHVSICKKLTLPQQTMRPLQRYLIDRFGVSKEDAFMQYKQVLPSLPLYKMLVFDAFTGNEDRHLFNIDIIVDVLTGEERLAPIFDNGASLLSWVDAKDLKLASHFNKLDRAKPFRTTHQKQIKLVDQKIFPKINLDALYTTIIQDITPILRLLPEDRANAIVKYLKWRMRYIGKVMEE
ncbi:hypothetical protein [Bacillus toyonensis]|uniref:hypothetical protein n=1 Tax=Bacillus toyonensis TaxID=155322 RepID=UPI000BF8E4B3|nr:hypothetical protein [Bacillus toyonensis]PGF05282.1 hypothetical protein COM61_02400 [Bacillus toyonensis]